MERLVIERTKQRMSLQELSERSGLDAHTISDIERGRRRPRAMTVAKLAEALGLEPEELLEEAAAQYSLSAGDLTRLFRNLARQGQRIAARSVREGTSEELSRELADYHKVAAILLRAKGRRDIRGEDPEELAEAVEDYEEAEARIQSMLAQDLSASPAERAERQRFKDDKGSGYPEERGANAS